MQSATVLIVVSLFSTECVEGNTLLHSCASFVYDYVHLGFVFLQGLILDSIRHKSAHCVKRRVIYIGDGGGDYCPSLRLMEGDLVLARQG